MAEDTASAESGTNGSHERRECMPCGGSGRVISNLGGTPRQVTCPWCAGTGVRDPNADAQAAWREPSGEDGQGTGEQSRAGGESSSAE